MILQEFVRVKDKELEKALDKLNKKRAACKDNKDCQEPDCKCDWEGDCEDLCRYSMK